MNHPEHWCSYSVCWYCSAGLYLLLPQLRKGALEIVEADWKADVNCCCCYYQTCYSRPAAAAVVVVGLIGHLSCRLDVVAAVAGCIC